MGFVEVNAVIFVTMPLLVFSTGGWLYYCLTVLDFSLKEVFIQQIAVYKPLLN